MAIAGKDPSIKKKMCLLPMESQRCLGLKKSVKERKSLCLWVFCYKGGYRTFITGHGQRRRKQKEGEAFFFHGLLGLFLFSVLKYTLNRLITLLQVLL